jgi:esterase/lipase superfamily enzyme
MFAELPARLALTRRTILAGLGLLPLGGCLAENGGGLARFSARAGAETLAENPVLHILTTRKRAANPSASPFFEAGRASTFAYARALLNTPDPSPLGRVAALVTKDFGVQKLEALLENGAMEAALEALRGRDTLLYIHGYNQTFESAALEAARLSDGIGFKGNTLLFTWPSKGGLLDYGYDRESALLARDPFAEVLASLLQDAFTGRLHIVAHSMGTLVTLESLRIYRDREKDKGIEKLGALVLAAPDIDADLFRASVTKLGPFREKMTVITTTNDRALGLSSSLAGGERAGSLPPEALKGTGIRAVDATEFASGLIRHDAFLADADVRGVIRRAVERG